MRVPVLETERLNLRGHRLDDFAAYAAMWADPVVTRHIGGKPIPEEESWSRFLRQAGHWALLGFGYWVVEEKSTGTFAGEIGFANLRRVLEPPLGETPEIGWVLASLFHGKGYATEAVRAAVAWGDRHFGESRTACIIHPGNLASIRVAEKCGYRESLRTTYKGQPTILFVRELSVP
jgi:RimJ/RimL family protein N-acetyltransferase